VIRHLTKSGESISSLSVARDGSLEHSPESKQKDLLVSQEREAHWDRIAAQMASDIETFYASYTGQSMLASLRELLPERLDGARILDIGCGTGRYFPFFAQQGASTLVGVDIGSNLLSACRLRNVTVNLARASAVHLPFADGSFDVVCSLGLIEHFTDPSPVLAEFTRLISLGGTLILETPNMLNPAFTVYKIIHCTRLVWEHWWAPWNLRHLIRQETRLALVKTTSSVLASWLLTRIVAKAGSAYPGVPSALVRIERVWPWRDLGSMMFVSARRL
jgi:ubiquinone/menaquinone biosynthesis C-methylase UbiE